MAGHATFHTRTQAMTRRRHAGFTIVEIAVVVTIIAVLITAAFKGQAMLDASRVHDVVSLAQDMSVAMREFKKRYHLFPGDMLITAATPEIPGVPANCLAGGANAGDANGVITVLESACVPPVLFSAGYFNNPAVTTYFGTPSIVSASVSGVAMPPSVANVVLFTNLPCTVALEIDTKLDDGNLTSGKIQGTGGQCTPGTINDPVPLFAIGL